jgi:hypothetical protein
MHVPDGCRNPHTSHIDTYGYSIEAKVVLKADLRGADISPCNQQAPNNLKSDTYL